MKRLLQPYLFVLALTLWIHPCLAGDDTVFVPFDFPGSVFTTARDINPSGAIVGRYGTADKRTHGYVRSATGEFTSIDYPSAILTAAIGLNPQGDVVGVVRLPGQPKTSRHSFLLQNGAFTLFDCSGAASTFASSINARGEIVGTYTAADQTIHGFVYTDGACTTIDFPAAVETDLFKITSEGRILGAYVAADGTSHDFVLDHEEYTSVDVPGSPILTLDDGGLNNRGDIVGWFCVTAACAGFGDMTGFILTDEGFTTVDVPRATCVLPLAINSGGEIAGTYSTNTACTDFHGFVLTKNRGRASSQMGSR